MMTFSETKVEQWRIDRLLHIFKGNEDAAKVFWQLRVISHVWDDLVDGDKSVVPAEVNGAFWIALVELPMNPFYRQYYAYLHPAFRLGILEWFAANRMEADNSCPLDREISHVCRFDAADIVILMAEIIGGTAWAIEHAPELKRLVRDEPFADYVEGLK
jgi:hypothetical protein